MDKDKMGNVHEKARRLFGVEVRRAYVLVRVRTQIHACTHALTHNQRLKIGG